MPAKKAVSEDGFRNRIVELRYVPAIELNVNQKNWRLHPPDQRSALHSLLESIGVADAVLAYESERAGGALTLIDGHLRRELLEGDVPVLVTDLNDMEADALLAAHDVITTMAVPDELELTQLLEDVKDTLPRDVLMAIDPDFGATVDDMLKADGMSTAKYPIVAQLDEGYDAVIIFCARETDFAVLSSMLDLPTMLDRKQIGMSHVLTFDQFIERWNQRSES